MVHLLEVRQIRINKLSAFPTEKAFVPVNESNHAAERWWPRVVDGQKHFDNFSPFIPLDPGAELLQRNNGIANFIDHDDQQHTGQYHQQ